MYIENGVYRDITVAIKRLPSAVVITRDNLVELRDVRQKHA